MSKPATVAAHEVAHPQSPPAPSAAPEIVPPVNFEAMERVLAEAVGEQQPLLSAASTTRERLLGEMETLDGDRQDLIQRRDLFRRQMEAVIEGLDALIADREAAIAIYAHGLVATKDDAA